jgi:alpha-galactosidase
MIDHVKSVLADPKRVCPAYDPVEGYEVAGFIWFQGFNDLVDGNTYPLGPDGKIRDYSKYSEWLAHLIRDVRKDLGAAKMPFVIGVLGVDGLNAKANTISFREAMAAPASMPEFEGNVTAVQTAPFWSEELAVIDQKHATIRQMAYLLRVKDKNGPNKDGSMDETRQKEYLKKFEAETISPSEVALWKRGASNAGYHYLGCAKTFALMGRAFADANLRLLKHNAQ